MKTRTTNTELSAELEHLRTENARLRSHLYELQQAPADGAVWREAMLRLILAEARMGDGIWEQNHATGETFYSRSYKRMLGYGDEDFPRKELRWQDLIHPDDRPKVSAAVDDFMAGRSPEIRIEHRLRCVMGDYKWVLGHGIAIQRDAAGLPLLTIGTHTDITEVKRAEQALEASSKRLTSTIANLQEGVLLEDENRRIVLTNAAFCQMFDIPAPPDALVGADCSMSAEQSKGLFVDEEDFVQRIDELLRNRIISVGEDLRLKDGRIFRRDFVPIFGGDQYIGHLWKYRDITRNKQAEEVLRRSEEKYRGIIENMNLGLLEVDMEERIIYANQSFCQMTGYQSDELLGRVATQVLLKGENQDFMDEKNRSRRDGISDAYEIAMKTKRGELKWWLISGAPLYNVEHHQVGSIGIHLDITHQKQLEANLRVAKQQAEESARAKELFLANMSHEIRTPLNAIMGMARLLTRAALDSQQNSYLNAIITSAENLTVIVNDVLDLSKIEAGKVVIEQIPFQPRQVLDQVEKTLRYKAEEKGLSFDVVMDAELPTVVVGDPYRLTQVLLNLASNSVKFTEKGRVTVQCRVVNRTVYGTVIEFGVQDTGIGIDEAYLNRIFNDFSQEDSSITRKYGGTGLGLSISRRLVDLLGGELLIDSEKGQGTHAHFVLRLPLGAMAEPEMSEIAAEDQARREHLPGKRILLVEDNEFNRILARAILDETGVTVIEAENGAVAVEKARQEKFDLVLMDVQMPVMNGFEATAALRMLPGDRIPIIALTANAVQGERQRCLDAGMDDYLAKPFQESELLMVLTDWLGGNTVAEVAAPPPYQLDFLRQTARGNEAFVRAMLGTFLSSSEQILNDWATAAAGLDMPRLRALAHKLKPSLTHLRVHQAVPIVEKLEGWPDTDTDPTPFWRMVAELPVLLYPVIERVRADLRVMAG